LEDGISLVVHWAQGFSSQFQFDGNSFSNSHWPLKDEEAIDWCKRISKLSLDKGNKLKEGHGGLQRERIWGYTKGKEKKKKNVCEEIFFSSYVWRGAHGKCVCRN
jgi:hypothetical protein